MVGRPQWGTRKKGTHKKGTHKGCPYGMARDLSMPSTVGATLVVALRLLPCHRSSLARRPWRMPFGSYRSTGTGQKRRNHECPELPEGPWPHGAWNH
jgi:hypothetical protein